MQERTSTDVVVIGAGLAGLTAAILTARLGRRVRLVEKAGEVGGRATTQTKDGFSFNIGPHALYRGGAGMRVLKQIGVEPRGKTPPVSGAFAVRAGVKHALPGGFFSLVTTSLLNLPAKLELARLLSRLPSLDTAPFMTKTIAEAVAELARRDEVREFVRAGFRVATYGNAPDRQSAGSAIDQLKLALKENVMYLDGGWQQLVDALHAHATEAGVEVTSGERVDAVELAEDERSVRGVLLAGGARITCSAAILAVPPGDAAGLVGGAPGSTLARWASDALPVRAACLDLALASLPDPRATFALGMDRPLYLSVHSAAARLAPEGGALVHAARYLDPSEPEDAERDRGEIERVLDLVQPGWREQVVHKRFLPHLVVTHGLVTAARGATAGRPGPEVPGTRGLYVAGDWVGPEGQLADASLASARRAAESCVRDVPALAVAA